MYMGNLMMPMYYGGMEYYNQYMRCHSMEMYMMIQEIHGMVKAIYEAQYPKG